MRQPTKSTCMGIMDTLFCGLYSVVCAFVFIRGSVLLLKLVLSHLTTKQLTFLVRESEKIGSRHPPRFALLWLYTCGSLWNSEDEKIGTHVSVLATIAADFMDVRH